MPGKRLLICGPVIEQGLVGGLQSALDDLATGLGARGWHVDLAISPEALKLPSTEQRHADLEGLSGSRWSQLPRLHFLPTDLRTLLQHLLLDGGVARVQSDLLRALHARVRDVHYDAVIAVVSREAPGLARFITGAHPNVLILSLNGLSSELRLDAWLWLPRALARLSGARLHPDMYCAVEPHRIRMAAFASTAWYEDAVRAGLPRAAGTTIYFGVPHVPPLVPARANGNRLLWVGRLSREKGLHQFIKALALLRRSRPVFLTAICGQGPGDYRRDVVRLIADLGVSDAIELRPPVSRAELTDIYQSYDLLLFQSLFAEPVALVVLEAFAAGLPVVAPQPERRQRLLKPDETCVCFPTADPADIARVIERLLDDATLLERIRRTAHDLVRTEFSAAATAAAYDETLLTLLGERAAPLASVEA